MAKSLRSKWKRKMRAVKRVRYSVKELAKLNQMLREAGEIGDTKVEIKIEKMDDDGEVGGPSSTTSTSPALDGDEVVLMEETPEAQPGRTTRPRQSRLDTMLGGKPTTRRTDSRPRLLDGTQLEKLPMTERVYSRRTMKDQFGNYPSWMGKRKMKTQILKNRRANKRRSKSAVGKK